MNYKVVFVIFRFLQEQIIRRVELHFQALLIKINNCIHFKLQNSFQIFMILINFAYIF